MDDLHYDHDELYLEKINLSHLAQQFGTPLYVYSKAILAANWRAFANAFKTIPHRICYSVKANSNLSLLKLFSEWGAGFDIVSLGELNRVIKVHGNPQLIIFSGVGKKKIEIEQAIAANIYCFNVESEQELERINTIATTLGKKVNISLRMNPDVDALTHAHISTGLSENKFGIDRNDILPLCKRLINFPSINMIGLASHIGSQILDLKPFLLTIDRLLETYQQINSLGIRIQHLNIGGGLGIRYDDENPPSIKDYANALEKKLKNLPLELIIEPGRAMVGKAGLLLTRIEYLKQNSQKKFAIVDAGMNDLIRPALYDAWHNILPVLIRSTKKEIYDIAGPVCESADFFGKNRELAIKSGDLLAITAAGAYGFSMSSNYNSRCKPAEVLVDQDKVQLIRKREKIEDLLMEEFVD